MSRSARVGFAELLELHGLDLGGGRRISLLVRGGGAVFI